VSTVPGRRTKSRCESEADVVISLVVTSARNLPMAKNNDIAVD
jgi:hypothetical protein